jgi:hydrogenase/urease accessory protein HupE
MSRTDTRLTALLFLVSLVPAAAHELWMTGVSIEVGDRSTDVTVRAHRPNVAGDPGGRIAQRLHLRFDGRRFEPQQATVETDLANDIVIWRSSSPVIPVTVIVERPVFPDLPRDETVVTLVRGGVPAGTAILNAESGPVQLGESTPSVAGRFLVEGIRHILGGLDHIAFLLALLLPVRRVRDIVKLVTAFTVAHSITLSVAALGLADVPSRIIEPLIAMSIVAAAGENLLSRTGEIRMRLLYAFGFGLIHGFGFAGSLSELELPRYALGWSLASFNLGVEIGQLMIIAVVMPLLMSMERRTPAWRASLVRFASIGIAAGGLVVSVQRAIS